MYQHILYHYADGVLQRISLCNGLYHCEYSRVGCCRFTETLSDEASARRWIAAKAQ